LYERYTSLDNAEEAFTSVLKMDPHFEKSNEIHFRLGIIYKQQMKYAESLEQFGNILQNPPSPLTEADIWFQIGHVYEFKKDFVEARKSYERVLKFNPNHAKVLQQLGWLYHQNTQFGDQDIAISYLQRSIDAEPSDGQTWYFLGRCFMVQQKYRSAYDAYQQAVFRDGRNPTFWCSIGVLYYQINQYKDALDAYSRAIRLNPYLSEVWYDLGTLYESCNQLYDALDAYQRAADLDPKNKHIQQRLNMLRSQVANKNQPHAIGDKKDGTLAPINAVEPSPNNRFTQQTPPPPMPIQPKSGSIAPPTFNELSRSAPRDGFPPHNMGPTPGGPGGQLPSLSSNAPNPNATLSSIGGASQHHSAPSPSMYNSYNGPRGGEPSMQQRPDMSRNTAQMSRATNVSPFGQNRYPGAPQGYGQQPPMNQSQAPVPSQIHQYPTNYPSNAHPQMEQIPSMESLDKTPTLQERDNLKRPSPSIGNYSQPPEQDRKRQKFTHYAHDQQANNQSRPQGKRNEEEDDEEDEDEMVIHEDYPEETRKRRENAARVEEQSRNGKQEPPSVVVNKEDGSPKRVAVNGEEGNAMKE
jgi:glucose repression mediator protein